MKSTPTEQDRAIGSRLRRLRMSKGISQQRMAEMLGLTFQQVQKYEHGRNRMPFSRAISACRALGVPLDTLAYGQGMEG